MLSPTSHPPISHPLSPISHPPLYRPPFYSLAQYLDQLNRHTKCDDYGFYFPCFNYILYVDFDSDSDYEDALPLKMLLWSRILNTNVEYLYIFTHIWQCLSMLKKCSTLSYSNLIFRLRVCLPFRRGPPISLLLLLIPLCHRMMRSRLRGSLWGTWATWDITYVSVFQQAILKSGLLLGQNFLLDTPQPPQKRASLWVMLQVPFLKIHQVLITGKQKGTHLG